MWCKRHRPELCGFVCFKAAGTLRVHGGGVLRLRLPLFVRIVQDPKFACMGSPLLNMKSERRVGMAAEDLVVLDAFVRGEGESVDRRFGKKAESEDFPDSPWLVRHCLPCQGGKSHALPPSCCCSGPFTSCSRKAQRLHSLPSRIAEPCTVLDFPFGTPARRSRLRKSRAGGSTGRQTHACLYVLGAMFPAVFARHLMLCCTVPSLDGT